MKADTPRIISVDDHVIEPPELWQDRMAAAFRNEAPRLQRIKGRLRMQPRHAVYEADDGGDWADCWVYGGLNYPITGGFVAASFARDEARLGAVLYDEIRPGCWQQKSRLADMDENYVEAALCFPTFPRFCGQTFLEQGSRELALECVKTYNDWMVDEWCAGEGYGRLIPLAILPLWDPELAAAEVRRCAARGCHAVAFSENPVALGLPSVHTRHWDPLWSACEETDTVVNMHIGSSSTFTTTSPDAPTLVTIALTSEGSSHAFVDWISSGILERFPTLRIALSEGQVGWMPFLMERLDGAWAHIRRLGGASRTLPNPPSSYVAGRIFGCVFDDTVGLQQRQSIGMDQILFETDFPHMDTTFPHSRQTAEGLVAAAGLDEHETWQLLRGNAISCYRLDRIGITN